MRNGQVMPYACGALRSQKILGYNIDFDADNITTQSIRNRFAHVIVIIGPGLHAENGYVENL